MKKIVRSSTIPLTLNTFCSGLMVELSEDYEVVALSSPGQELDDLALKNGIRTIAIPMERHIAPWRDLVALWRITKALRREKPDMVHSMTPKAGLLTMVAARMASVPLRVHTFTGLVFPTAQGMKRRLLMLTDRVTCACATHIIPEGEGVKSDLLRFGITRKQMKVLGHGNVRGIDLIYYCRTPKIEVEARGIRQSLNIPRDAFTFIFVGRLVADKGIGELVEAFSVLRSLHEDVHLLLVGGEEQDLDPLDSNIRHKIAHDEHIHQVEWQGDVRPWYVAADALVLPSYREGFPNVVLEAGAMGLPSIVTDVNGSREIIREGENGTIVPPRNEEELLSAMISFVEDKDKTLTMASKARRLVASRYEQSYVRQCLKDFYNSLLS